MPAAREGMAAEGAESKPMPPVTQSRMENFRKVKTSEEDSPLPFTGLAPDVVEMKVKEGSKIRNLMGFAMSRMELKGTRQIVFSGCGRAVTKTITCVEIMKRKLGGLHQVTKVRYKTLVEVWENKDPLPNGQVETLTVHKNVPSICILLSKDPLDPSEMGYQPPEPREGLWPEEEEIEDEISTSSPKGMKRPLTSPQEELNNKKLQLCTKYPASILCASRMSMKHYF
ncbi:ribonuclease P protein subunit p25 isoform B [Alligator mississippiensis]|uniref:Ribonuclease P protein subunit p25 isoform B n=1 Tax=Alligator mississippiensis TaxID=8496 RepID=A0A151M9T3_ALLMI|nr:ribonuclease P protein subunit p25 isoform B [Alligator mississippiensis]